MKNFNNSIISTNAKILDAINAINNSEAKIALVIDHFGKLCGTITDGDIRRSFLNNCNLQTDVNTVMNKNYLSIFINEDFQEARKLMIKKGINYLPVLDLDRKFKNLLCIQDFKLKNSINYDVVIMAGGRGTRLKPYTNSCPKPMLEIKGKPMLEHILENCISCGFNNFFFSVNYLKENIMNYFGDGSEWNVNINYLIEKEELGTAGSLSLLRNVGDNPIIVLNGDILTKFDFSNLYEFHLKNKLDATIAVREEIFKIPFGVVESKGINLLNIHEKPLEKKIVNAGVYCLSPNTLEKLKEEKYWDMPDFLLYLKKFNFSIGVFPIHEYWIDVGRPETLIQAKKEWKEI